MKTNFAYIDHAVEEAVGREFQEPRRALVPYERLGMPPQKIIAGFAVADQSTNSRLSAAELKRRRGAIDAYRNSAVTVRQNLDKTGISPLAVLPKSIWDRICERSGLYQLAPQGGGKIPVQLPHFKKFEWAAALTSWLIAAAALLATFALWAVIVLNPTFTYPGHGLLTFAVTMGIVWYTLHFESLLPLRHTLRRMFIKLLGPHHHPLESYFPDRRSTESADITATLVLPQPPADVEDVLLRVHNFHELKVALVSEAISFVETPTELLLEQHSRLTEEEWVQRAVRIGYGGMVTDCPIIYIEHQGVVAVIAQFGDFPIEEEVVNEVLNSEHLL